MENTNTKTNYHKVVNLNKEQILLKIKLHTNIAGLPIQATNK